MSTNEPQQVAEVPTLWERFRSYWQMEDRDWRCLLFSAICHTILLFILCIFVLPPAGRPDSRLLDVSFVSEKPDSGEPKNNQAQEPREQEVDPLLEETSEKTLKELQESFKMDDADEVKQYLRQRQEKIAQKKQKLQDFEKQRRQIDKDLGKRSRYGTLQPRTFYGVQLFARSMVFVLDISGSMDIREARLQLKNAYQSLKSNEYFNIIVYSQTITSWKDQLVKANKENKQDADTWVDKLYPGGATNIYGALQRSFAVAWEQTRAEVIYLLSDGLPTAGPVQHPMQILAAVRSWNNNKKIVIHTIGIGPHQDKKFLGTLAEQNYGRYYVR